ncbi:hypothetical protein CAEBREN_00556 [Caenorhabditis brenneri]|uniref:Uncharacterized protein n=1 Tax=Caenorhabditis brenneri TaxID=135651 RepID=G0N1E5_CAEBE|nr:hypothetical protein CAEBREN_00556 [Caenorhabditis brenneri]
MGPNDRRRERLLERKVFKNYGNWNYEECFVIIFFAISLPSGIMLIVLAAEVTWYGAISLNVEYAGTVSWTIIIILFYTFGFVITIVTTCLKVPDKFFRLCSFLAIFHLLLIIFLVVHPFQAFVPGPETKMLEEQFESGSHHSKVLSLILEFSKIMITVSVLAKFIWIPCLIVPVFLCSIFTWKASDQSELYTVILDGKRSSTKIIDV